MTDSVEQSLLVGQRVSVRRPKELFVDEITVTRGAIGPRDTPSLIRRWGLVTEPNYTQVLGVKRFSRMVAGSVEYDRQIGSNILRGAVTFRFKHENTKLLGRFIVLPNFLVLSLNNDRALQ